MAHFARRVYILQLGCNEVLNERHAFRKKKKIMENTRRHSSVHSEFSSQERKTAEFHNGLKLASL